MRAELALGVHMFAGGQTLPRVVLFSCTRKGFARLESRDKLSDVIESASSITCSCAVSISGTPGEQHDNRDVTFDGVAWEWVAGPTRASSEPPSRPSSHKRIFLSAQMATTCCPEWLTCSREATASRHEQQDRTWGKAETGGRLEASSPRDR